MTLKNTRHERFCLEYAKYGDASKAYSAAYPNSAKASSNANGQRLIKNPKIQARLKELAEEMRSSAIANAAEIQERLTTILRGELQEEVIVIEGIEKGVTEARVMQKHPSHSDAIKAAQTLAKMQGAFDQNVSLNLIVPKFTGEDDLED